MKKLMMAAAIVCAAAAAHAATYNWNFVSADTLYAGYKAATVGGSSSELLGSGATAYLIAYNATSMNQNTILSGLRDGKDVATIAGVSLIKSSTTGSDSKIESATWTDSVGASITAFEVVVSSDGKNVYLSGDNTFAASADPLSTDVAWATGTTKKLRDNDGTTNFGSTGWYSTVPEPTSGLLLLLGMAGLALRRRRA